ncbi:protein arginine N-methyltransferase PRMT10 [Phragmites australis]|uniref:protein arginine N-methyltransferase PRMT10 n=1 Tax=Phragmites australis TaxID=29695 RepID=UPI002D792A19|nr:protein arginine N-methyltransferase PRMT10 [Phragmites australis]
MASLPNGAAATGSSGAPAVDKEVDFANYFCTYAYLYHQKEMLCDRVRMDAYHSAVFRNAPHFRGKVVLDVGTGSGILAIWSAQAGARKVYAVEATDMAEHARELARANGVADIVEVIQGTVEDVVLPEKVDVIISEWMGYFLLRESMFDSVICARDRWLKPDGVMYPSHARMWLAPIRTGLGDKKMEDFDIAMDDWNLFVEDTQAYYGVNMNALTKAYRSENEKYYLKSSIWNNLHPNQVIGQAAVIKEIDCLTATVDDIREVRAQVMLPISLDEARLAALAGWFDVHFRGSKQNPAVEEVELNTAPNERGGTHWGQQVFLLKPPLKVTRGDSVKVSFSMVRSKENHRLMDMEFTYELHEFSGKQHPAITTKMYLE